MSGAFEPFDELDTLSAGELERWWTRKLRRVLRLAAAELPFYRERFEAAGFDASRFRTLADLSDVPVFDKQAVLAAQRDAGRHVFGIERLTPGRTANTVSLSSGTAGTTFISHTPRWRRLQGYSSARCHWWAGLRPGTPFVLSAPAWHSYASVQPVLAERFEKPCVVVSGTYLPRFADRIVDALRRFRPAFVTMFLPMVFSILAEGRRQGLEPRAVFDGVETLVVTGAPITRGMRRHLREVTGVERVAEIAGTSENVLAVDCERGDGLHVVPDTCYVEVLSLPAGTPAPPGERGSIVHCYLIDEGSIYLRYDSGDAGEIDPSPCACGRPSPRIRMLGRWETSFVLGARRWLPGDVQVALEESLPELVGVPFVIVREGLGAGRLQLLLPNESLSGSLRDGIRLKLGARFGVPVEVQGVRELPLRFKGVSPVLSAAEVEGGLG